MDSTIRLFAKAITWQVAGFFSMMLIGFLFTGSVVASGGIALAGSLSGFVAYFLHEMIWSRVAWGRGMALPGKPNWKPAHRTGPGMAMTQRPGIDA